LNGVGLEFNTIQRGQFMDCGFLGGLFATADKKKKNEHSELQEKVIEPIGQWSKPLK
jgi:hypothetical protein